MEAALSLLDAKPLCHALLVYGLHVLYADCRLRHLSASFAPLVPQGPREARRCTSQLDS